MSEYINTTRVTNLQRYGDRGWLWHIDGHSGYYYTSKNGEGIFHDDPEKGVWNRQITGLCQFTACSTRSGMRRKLIRLYEND